LVGPPASAALLPAAPATDHVRHVKLHLPCQPAGAASGWRPALLQNSSKRQDGEVG
jgi:hypothetical protein